MTIAPRLPAAALLAVLAVTSLTAGPSTHPTQDRASAAPPRPAAAIDAGTLGVCEHIWPGDVLLVTSRLGVSWIRIDVNWLDVQFGPTTYYWDWVDRVINEANALGLNVYATVGYTPEWASTGNRLGDGSNNDVPEAQLYRAFVETAAARYADGRVKVWSLWNEPEFSWFFEGSVDEWVSNVLVPGIDGVQAGCPSCLIAAPDGYGAYAHLAAALDARGVDIDIISWHVYDEMGPHVLDRVRQVIVDKGYAQPVWMTETGRPGAIDDPAGLESQRQWVLAVLDAMPQRPWWERTFFYEIEDVGLWAPYGLARRRQPPHPTAYDSFIDKPAYTALRDTLPARLSVANTTPEQGTVRSSPGGIDCGSACQAVFDRDGVVTLAAHPKPRSVFLGWTGACVGLGPCQLAIDGSHAVVAGFGRATDWRRLTLVIRGGGSGVLTSNPEGLRCPGQCVKYFARGSTVTVTPTPADGSMFLGWQGAGCATGTVVVGANRTCTARFEIARTLNVTVANEGGATGSVVSRPAGIDCGGACSGQFPDGQWVTLVARPGAGDRFAGWSGSCSGTGLRCRVRMEETRAVTAGFSR